MVPTHKESNLTNSRALVRRCCDDGFDGRDVLGLLSKVPLRGDPASSSRDLELPACSGGMRCISMSSSVAILSLRDITLSKLIQINFVDLNLNVRDKMLESSVRLELLTCGCLFNDSK